MWGGHSDPDIRGGGAVSKKVGPHFGRKIRGAGPPGPSLNNRALENSRRPTDFQAN